MLKIVSTSRVEQTGQWKKENHCDSISAAQRGKSTSEFKTLWKSRKFYTASYETEIKLALFSSHCMSPLDTGLLFLLNCLYFRFFNPLRPLTLVSFDFSVEGNRYVSDGTHQCCAWVVKLSASDRLTDVVNTSITTTERAEGLEGERYRAKDMHREREKNEGKQVHWESHAVFSFVLWALIKSGTKLKP